MKVLSFSRISFVCALLLGAMTLWLGAAPSATGADSFVGGWTLIGRCPTDCDGQHTEWCRAQAPAAFRSLCRPGFETTVCEPDSSGWGECDPQGYDYCDSPIYSCPGSETFCT